MAFGAFSGVPFRSVSFHFAWMGPVRTERAHPLACEMAPV